MFSSVCTTVSDDVGHHMTYYDGFQIWDQCRRCGTIQAVLYYPHRQGFLVPLCSDCAEEGADLLQRGRSVVKPPRKQGHTVEHRFLEDDYDIID